MDPNFRKMAPSLERMVTKRKMPRRKRTMEFTIRMFELLRMLRTLFSLVEAFHYLVLFEIVLKCFKSFPER